MSEAFLARLRGELEQLAAEGLSKPERRIVSPQGPEVIVAASSGEERRVLNLCANDYLGLAADERVIAAAQEAAARRGAGLASVRFICGTQDLHKALEAQIAGYVRHEDAILFAACFDANAAVFEPLFGDEDAIVSDALNHASVIDGIRLCKARRYRYRTGDMEDLETRLAEARVGGARSVVIATDGVFSMDGHIARLDEITRLADRYEALVMVDDCHATGLLGDGGRGSAAYRAVEGRIDILTGTFGKALGGAMGGFVAGRREIVDLLRQRARPYLFSNALAPAICGAATAAIDIAASLEGAGLRARLFGNAKRLRSGLSRAGFQLVPGEHPIIPVMLGDAALAQAFARGLLERGVLATGFSYPVVARGAARIRTQVSAAHTPEQIDAAVAAFTAVGQELSVALA